MGTLLLIGLTTFLVGLVVTGIMMFMSMFIAGITMMGSIGAGIIAYVLAWIVIAVLAFKFDMFV